MKELTKEELQKDPDVTVEDDNLIKRPALVMIPKNNDFDPDFPVICYRKGKYVTLDEAKKQQTLEFMSKSLYDLCIAEKREDLLACYKQKCSIFRTIMQTIKKESTSNNKIPPKQ